MIDYIPPDIPPAVVKYADEQNKNIVILFLKKFLLLFFLLIFVCNSSSYAEVIYKPKYMPRKVKKLINPQTAKNEIINVIYIMKWHKYKVYRIYTAKKGLYTGGAPQYVLFDGKIVRHPTTEEDKILQLDATRFCHKKRYKDYLELSKKLQKKANKTMTLVDKTEPPEVPLAINTYADKYMMKGKGRKIFYLMDWEGQHVYRTYWPHYGLLPVPKSVILYDGNIIRHPTKEEFEKMRIPMEKAYFKRLSRIPYDSTPD